MACLAKQCPPRALVVHFDNGCNDEFGRNDYGGKHYESIFTRFYQGYILPTKYGLDK